MKRKVVIQDTFYGGIAQGSKKAGYEGSFQDGIALDYMSDPDKLQVATKPTKNSGSTVTDLPLFHTEFDDADFFYGDTGKIYRRTSAGTWSNLKTVTDSVGNGIETFNNKIWYMSNTAIGTIEDPTGTPVYTDDYFETPRHEVDQWTDVTGNTYTLPTAISETAANRESFTVGTGVDNISGIAVELMARGTGNWTVTLHDASNVVLGIVTIANADLSSGTNAITWFMFDEPIPVTAATTYHYHVTSTVADGTVRTLTASDLETANSATLRFIDNTDVDQSNELTATDRNGLTQTADTYTPLTYVDERVTHKTYFTPEKSSLTAIAVNAYARTAGTWTLVVHDSNNNTIYSGTYAVGDFKERGFSKLILSAAVTLTPGAEYHFHILESTGSGRIFSSDGTSAAGLFYRTHFEILHSNPYHMCREFTNLLCIGNGNYVATIDDSEIFDPERIQLPLGENVRSLETIGGYLAITTTKGDSIGDRGKSRIYFWDGRSITFNDFVDLDGQPNAIVNNSNMLDIIHGVQGTLSRYTGAVTKIRDLKYATTGVTLEVLPGAIDTLKGITYFGVSNVSNNAVTTCVYSYGALDKDFPRSLNKPWVISTGDKTNDVDIGLVKTISESKIFIGWKDGSTYGVDLIDQTKKQATAEYASLREGTDSLDLSKSLRSFVIRCSALAANQKIQVLYRLNNKGSFVELGSLDYDNDTDDQSIIYRSLPINITNNYWFEIEFKLVITNSGSNGTMPDILMYSFEYDILGEIQGGRKT